MSILLQFDVLRSVTFENNTSWNSLLSEPRLKMTDTVNVIVNLWKYFHKKRIINYKIGLFVIKNQFLYYFNIIPGPGELSGEIQSFSSCSDNRTFSMQVIETGYRYRIQDARNRIQVQDTRCKKLDTGYKICT